MSINENVPLLAILDAKYCLDLDLLALCVLLDIYHHRLPSFTPAVVAAELSKRGLSCFKPDLLVR